MKDLKVILEPKQIKNSKTQLPIAIKEAEITNAITYSIKKLSFENPTTPKTITIVIPKIARPDLYLKRISSSRMYNKNNVE